MGYKMTSSKHSKRTGHGSTLPIMSKKQSALWKKLLGYQKDAVEAALKKTQCAIYFEPRTGKTYVTTGVLNRLATDDFEALIIVPLATKERTWARFLRECSVASIYTDLGEYKAASSPKILLLHYEEVGSVIKKLLKISWSIIVYDESHRLKGRNSKQSRNARRLRNRADRKLILTGTPLEKSPIDLWGQFRFLKPEILSDKWSHFDEKFLKPTGYMGYQRKFIDKRLPEFLRLIDPYCIRVTQQEVGFPEIEIFDHPIDLLGKQRKLYEELERESILFIKSKKVSAPFPMSRITKLQQCCGGFVIDDEKKVHFTGNAKIRRVRTLLKKHPKPFIICCRYLAEIEGLSKELSKDYRVCILTGEIRRNGLADDIVDDFQKGKYDILIMQTTVGKEGIDLSIAKHCILYSLTFSSIDFDQVKNRMQNLLHKVRPKLFLIYARNTVDEPIYQSIVHKRQVKDAVLTYLKRR